jgi:hypothetical protein
MWIKTSVTVYADRIFNAFQIETSDTIIGFVPVKFFEEPTLVKIDIPVKSSDLELHLVTNDG